MKPEITDSGSCIKTPITDDLEMVEIIGRDGTSDATSKLYLLYRKFVNFENFLYIIT